jgi:hypothetical protein
MEHALLTSLSLTPYDTGERLEPQLWPTSDDPETFGRVDFDDDEGRTVFTAYVERRRPGLRAAHRQHVRQDRRRDGGGLLTKQPHSRQQS